MFLPTSEFFPIIVMLQEKGLDSICVLQIFSPMWNQDVLSIYQISSPLSEGKASLSYVSASLFASYFASYELFPLLLIPCLACREDDGEVSF